MVLFQILLDGDEPRDAGRPSCLLQSAAGEANRILLASALSMHIICPNRVSWHNWIIAVSLGCFVDTLNVLLSHSSAQVCPHVKMGLLLKHRCHFGQMSFLTPPVANSGNQCTSP